MLKIYKSNHLEFLIKKVCKILSKKKTKKIFHSELFLTNNRFINNWINYNIAKKNKICANIKYKNINTFLIKIINYIKKYNDSSYIFKKKDIFWKLMLIIEEKCFNDIIKKNDPLKKKFQLCLILSNLFYKYIFSNPELIISWENNISNDFIKNDTYNFQKKIWIYLINIEKKKNFTDLIFSFLEKTKKNIFKNILPSQIFIISTKILKPLHTLLIHFLSEKTNIYLFLCESLKDEHNINTLKKLIQDKNKNSLTYKKKIIVLNKEIEKCNYKISKIKEKNFFCEKKIINILQKNILCNKYNYKNIYKNSYNQKRRIFKKNDKTLIIQDCISKRDEVENLYKYIINILKNNKSIKPYEILISSNKIQNYLPYIETIFKESKEEYSINLFYIKKNFFCEKNILNTLKKLFFLNDDRFKNNNILSLLDCNLLRKKFFIKKKDLEIIFKVIEKINIKWAFDSNHLKKMNIPEFYEYTWTYGINKIITGMFLKTENGTWKNIIPYNILSKDEKNIIGKFLNFLYTLNKWRIKLNTKRILKNWITIFSKLIEDFFYDSLLYNDFFYNLKKKWQKNIETGIQYKYIKKISINVLREEFLKTIKNFKHPLKFELNRINISYLNDFIHIPFKIICILGCDKYFLKSKNINEFSLIKQDEKKQKKLIYLEKRKIFINIIMSTRKYIFFSFSKNKKSNNNLNNISEFLEELLIYIKKIFYCKLYTSSKKIKNILDYLYIKKNIKKILIHKKNDSESINKKYKISIKYSKIINLKNIIEFWKNPIKYFFEKSLKIKNFSLKENQLTPEEPFLVKNLEKYKINKVLLDYMIHNNKKIDDFFVFLKNSGILPINNVGKIFLEEQIKNMTKISDNIKKKYKFYKKKKIEISIENFLIKHKIKFNKNQGIIKWTPNIINEKNYISLWIQHLFYCISGGKSYSVIIGLNNKIVEFPNISVQKSKEYLKKYILGYITGIKKPLFLLKSGISWINSIFKNKKKKEIFNKKKIMVSEKKFFYVWNGNSSKIGEKEDLFIRKIIPYMNKKYFKKICNTSKYFWIPILENKINKNN